MVFLTSTGFTNPKVYQTLEQRSPRSINRACIIDAGLRSIKNAHPVAKATYDFLAGKGIWEICFFDPYEDDSHILLNCDLITILGGDSCRLFSSIKNTGTDDAIKKAADEGVHIVGASAGAMLLASGNEYARYFSPILGIYEDFEELSDSKGLEFTNDVLFPHYDMFLQRVPDLDEKLNGIEEKFSISITRLKNMEFIYVDAEGRRVFVTD